MKKILTWGLYFIICGTVIVAAIMAGKHHAHCHGCDIALTGKSHEKNKLADQCLFIP